MFWLFMSMVMAAPWSALDRDWLCINDTVMGGVSRSSIQQTPSGSLVFQGTLSTKNNGGFTSTRSTGKMIDLRGAKQLVLKVKGDGRKYYATVRTATGRRNMIYYRQSFQTQANKETEIILPIEDFRPYAYGRAMPSYPGLEGALGRIASVGIMLADKKDGQFALEMLSFTADREKKVTFSVDTDLPRAQSLLMKAIEKGVPLYNGGQHQACADIYQTALEGILLLEAKIGDDRKQLLEAALRKAQAQRSPSERAWTFRYAIDAMLQ